MTQMSSNHPSSQAVSPRRVVVLGSTGSIGTQTLQVIQAFPDKLRVAGLSAGQNTTLFEAQCQQFQPQWACLAESQFWSAMTYTPPEGQCTGVEGLCALASHPEIDIVVVGLVGAVGIQPTLAALQAGKTVLTANKETFVAAGHLVQPYLSQIIPIDSEHSAIFQCLAGQHMADVAKLWLTASGGPFRTWPIERIQRATRAEALKHPNWQMGAKISIDSATMMNKGLEVIEAYWLFGLPVEAIEIVVHPQSVVHSGIELMDGTVLTQWGTPDMRVPIQYGFSSPRRWAGPFAEAKLACPPAENLTFEPPDLERFPAIPLAYHAAQKGSGATAVLNAANEVAVARFLADELAFADITACVESTLLACPSCSTAPSLEEILTLDTWARQYAQAWRTSVLVGM